MQTGDTDYICKDDFCKACFQHAMAYGKLEIKLLKLQLIQNVAVIKEDWLL